MTDLTFIIPIGLAHQNLAQRALDSVAAQTVKCDVAALVDTERVGPGVLRNRMLRDVQTDFVAFLDADDWIEPTFAAETLAAYQQIGGNRYIFTDWYDNRGEVVQTPCLNGANGYPVSVPDRKPYCGGTWHVLTTLIPTAWARDVGGFDEGLPGFEDSDFFLKLCASGRCGHHLGRALFHYAPNGGRALAFLQHPDHEAIKIAVMQRYGGRMGCCGDNSGPAVPVGAKQDGDVLAMALWRGNRGEVGRVTRRVYPRISFPRTAWVDPRDVAQSPMLWKLVEQPQPAPQPPVIASGGLQMIAQAGLAGVKRVAVPDYAPPKDEPPPPPVQARPDVSRIMRLGQKLDEPVFIFPEKDYPSYGDIKRLVQFAGFDSATRIDAFSRRPLIIVSPEALPDLDGIKARVIAWQLEYAGDYTHNYDGFAGEVWASDKAWAEAHGAKYVLMGSHRDLASFGPEAPVSSVHRWDVTMLAYMTPRRQAIKAQLSDLSWPEDYPGHDTAVRFAVLSSTRLMLHVHQHDNAPFVAPQRIALAAAYHLPVISETTPGLGDLAKVVDTAAYEVLPDVVRARLQNTTLGNEGDLLYHFLCVSRTFRTCVMEALQS